MRNFFFEHRLMHFSPGGQGGPSGAPGQNPGQPQTPEKKTLKQQVEALVQANTLSQGDVPKVGQMLQEIANLDQAQAETKLRQQLGKAMALRHAALIDPNGADKLSPEDALTKVRAEYAAVTDVRLALDEQKKPVIEVAEVQRPEPRTHEERIMQGMEDAMAVLSEEGASIGKKIGAIFKLLALAKEFMKRGMDGTLGDSYESPTSQRTREQREASANRNRIRAQIRQDLQSKDFDELTQETERDLNSVQGELRQKEAAKTTADQDMKRLQDELKAVTGDTDADKQKRTDLNEQISAKQQEIAALQAEIDGLKKKEADLKVRLEEIDKIKEEREQWPSKLEAMLNKLGEALKKLPEDKVPGAATLGSELMSSELRVETEGMQYKIFVGTSTLGDRIAQVFADLKNELPDFDASVSPEDMGMDADGLIVDTDKFIGFMTAGLFTKISEAGSTLNDALKQEVQDALDGKDENGTVEESRKFPEGPERQAVVAALESPGSWQEVAGDPATNEVVFAVGSVWRQSKDGLGVARLNIEVQPPEWEDQSDKYFNGTELKDIPEDDPAGAREQLFEWNQQQHEWIQKPLKDVMDNATDLQQSALDAPGEWHTEGGISVFYDGQQTMYEQSETEPMSYSKLNVNYYVDVTNNDQWEVVDDQYINTATNQPVELPITGDTRKLRRACKFEEGQWVERTRTELFQHTIDAGYDRPGPDHEAFATPNEWANATAAGEDDFYFDGTDFYLQLQNGTRLNKLDFENYVDGGSMRWSHVEGKYLNGAGELVDLPSEDTHEWNDEDHIWELDIEKSIEFAMEDVWEEDYKVVAETEGWLNSLPDHPEWEGIRLGVMVYTQRSDAPDTLYSVNLDTGEWEKQKGFYLNGSKKVVQAPKPSRRGSYDEDARTWEEISQEASEERTEQRIEHGADKIAMAPGGLTAEASPDKKDYKITGKTGPNDADKHVMFHLHYSDTRAEWMWKWDEEYLSGHNWDTMSEAPSVANNSKQEFKDSARAFASLQRDLLNSSLDG